MVLGIQGLKRQKLNLVAFFIYIWQKQFYQYHDEVLRSRFDIAKGLYTVYTEAIVASDAIKLIVKVNWQQNDFVSSKSYPSPSDFVKLISSST